MTRQINIAALAALSLVAFANPASAQIVAHHHASTFAESWQRGYADRMRQYGEMQRLLAEADEIQVRADSAYVDLQYQLAERHFQQEQMKLEFRKQKRDDRLARQAAASAAEETSAMRLWKNAQQGAVIWPAALTRPEYSASMSLVESILRNWSPKDEVSSPAYRRALATEAGVLRAKIGGNKAIAYQSRLEAVRTLKRLQILANVTDMANAGPQLAMR